MCERAPTQKRFQSGNSLFRRECASDILGLLCSGVSHSQTIHDTKQNQTRITGLRYRLQNTIGSYRQGAWPLKTNYDRTSFSRGCQSLLEVVVCASRYLSSIYVYYRLIYTCKQDTPPEQQYKNPVRNNIRRKVSSELENSAVNSCEGTIHIRHITVRE